MLCLFNREETWINSDWLVLRTGGKLCFQFVLLHFHALLVHKRPKQNRKQETKKEERNLLSPADSLDRSDVSVFSIYGSKGRIPFDGRLTFCRWHEKKLAILKSNCHQVLQTLTLSSFSSFYWILKWSAFFHSTEKKSTICSKSFGNTGIQETLLSNQKEGIR